MKGVFGFIVLVLFVVLAVLVYTGLSAIFAPPSWEQQQLQQRIERERYEAAQARAAALEPWIRLFFFSLLIAGAFFALGASGYGVYHLFTRPARVKADANGIFPIEVWRTGGKVIVYDPNRSLAAGTVISLERKGADVVHCVAPGQEDAQRQAATQGAAIQAIRAGVSGAGVDDAVHALVERLLPGAGAGFPPVQPLPGVGDEQVGRLLEAGPEEG
jgi:hypothetical protein